MDLTGTVITQLNHLLINKTSVNTVTFLEKHSFERLSQVDQKILYFYHKIRPVFQGQISYPYSVSLVSPHFYEPCRASHVSHT